MPLHWVRYLDRLLRNARRPEPSWATATGRYTSVQAPTEQMQRTGDLPQDLPQE